MMRSPLQEEQYRKWSLANCVLLPAECKEVLASGVKAGLGRCACGVLTSAVFGPTSASFISIDGEAIDALGRGLFAGLCSVAGESSSSPIRALSICRDSRRRCR